MNLVILTSWYTLKGATVITSGYLFFSSSKITSPVEFTELSSLQCTRGNTDTSVADRTVHSAFSFTQVRYSFSMFWFILSEYISFKDHLFIVITFITSLFKEINTDLTKWLTAIEQLTTEEIQQLLETKLHDSVMEICHSWSQGTFLNIQLSSISQELPLTYIANSSSEFKTHLLIKAGETLKYFWKQSGQVFLMCIFFLQKPQV